MKTKLEQAKAEVRKTRRQIEQLKAGIARLEHVLASGEFERKREEARAHCQKRVEQLDRDEAHTRKLLGQDMARLILLGG